ncbi:hypothetical protein PHMEG_0003853 [Phytophthora megakarya]|uniref:Uncharacterized protein n=1 Tax=Phytophthora megakarya TaxID=4795 RepID=A0A225WWX2_9STRA|nr:hypothetical protein PHMEG_0003853 [Phytophthora megakarya]
MIEKGRKNQLFASKTYLTEFEYDISANESNFEALYQHVASGILQDAIWLNRRDVCGRTMLHDAAEFGHSNVMELLLKARVIVDAKDSRGDTPLHYAARHGRLKEVSMLLREHATPWMLNAEGKSPLYSALETAAKRPPRSTSHGNGAEILMDSKPSAVHKNFFLAHHSYPQLRQVIDLLWDSYALEHLTNNDRYDRTNCLELEKQVYGDMAQACHDGNLLRIQRLVDLEKRPVLQYINDQMEILQRTSLHEATEQGHTATVDLLLKLGADGYLQDQRLQTPLHLVACKGYDSIAKCLISKFPQSVSFQDISGSTPLVLAIQRQHWNIAMDLISLVKCSAIGTLHTKGQCLDLQDIHGYTALHYACLHGNIEICSSLISAGATLSISRCEYRIAKGTPHLLGMWWKGDCKHSGSRKSFINTSYQLKFVDIEAPIELLIKGYKQNVSNLQDRIDILELLQRELTERIKKSESERSSLVKVGSPPLFHIAAELSDINISVAVEICRRLHNLQVDIDMAHPQTMETVLLQECKRICVNATAADTDGLTSDLALVRTLLELGANTDIANEMNGESPLGCAAWYGHLALLDLLLEAGADKDGFLRRCSFSPLHFAALGNNVSCAKMLIGQSAIVNVDITPTNAETPLCFAIRSKSADMVELLLRSNSDPCSLCTSSMAGFNVPAETPIHIAIACGHLEIVQYFAISSLELPTVIKLLELRQFDLLALDQNKQTPLHLAAEGGDDNVCRLLLAKLQSNTPKATAIDVPDIHGRTALHLAIIHGHETTANVLLTAGASLAVRCHNGLTALLYAAKCNRLGILIALYAQAQPKPKDARTILHYAAIYGDVETPELLRKILEKEVDDTSDLVNMQDSFGYTPLMYAFAFGRLRVVRILCELGADPYTSIDHSGYPNSHPYTVGFDIGGLLQWFALPGWYSFVCKYLPPEVKARLVSTNIDEDYMCHSSFNYRKKRYKPVEWRTKWKQIPGARFLKSAPRHRGKELVRTSIRSWRFPRKSIFDYVCEIGCNVVLDLLVNLHLPQLFRSLSYQVQRRNFMQAVRWNRLEIVKTLIASATPGNTAIELTTGNHFLDFVEAGIECSVSRGLENMAIYLVGQWRGNTEYGGESVTPSAFAFQFASAFQVACIRRLPKLMKRMIECGGEEIVEFHLNDGPALVYALAFGSVEITNLLLRHGADPGIATATYSVASVRKWIEFGSPKDVRVAWQPQTIELGSRSKRPAFVGPLETYETSIPRLPIDELCRSFENINLDNSNDVNTNESNERSTPDEQASIKHAGLMGMSDNYDETQLIQTAETQ